MKRSRERHGRIIQRHDEPDVGSAFRYAGWLFIQLEVGLESNGASVEQCGRNLLGDAALEDGKPMTSRPFVDSEQAVDVGCRRHGSLTARDGSYFTRELVCSPDVPGE